MESTGVSKEKNKRGWYKTPHVKALHTFILSFSGKYSFINLPLKISSRKMKLVHYSIKIVGDSFGYVNLLDSSS
jgi:hypothetical protein